MKKPASGKFVARVVCAVAVAVASVSVVAYAAQPQAGDGTGEAQQATVVETVEADGADGQDAAELPPLTEDIYYQGSAAPANEPYFADEDRVALPSSEGQDAEQAA